MKQQVSTLGFVAICAVYMFTGGSGSMNPTVAGVAHGLNMDPGVVMQMGSFPALFILLGSLILGRIVGTKVKYKTILIIGLLAFSIGGTLPLFIHNWTLILFSRACVGFGVGVLYITGSSLVLKLYDPDKQGTVIGRANAAATITGIITQLLSGVLVDINWSLAFIVHLLGIIPLILVIIGLPEPERTEEEKKAKVKVILPAKVYINSCAVLFFMMFMMPLILSLSVIITQRNFGTGAEAGLGMTFFQIAGVVFSLLLGVTYRALKKFSMVILLAAVTLGMFIVYFSTSLAMIYVGMCFVGVGLLMVPVLMLDNGKLVPPESIPYLTSMVIIFMYVGSFLSSYFLQLLNVFTKNMTMDFPGLFVGSILMTVLTVIFLITRLVQKDTPTVIES